MRKIVYIIGQLSFYFYPPKLKVKIKNLKKHLFTGWISQIIGSIGRNSTIDVGCQVRGAGCKNIHIGHDTQIDRYAIIECMGLLNGRDAYLRIGDNCCIGEWNHFSAACGITIGNGLLTGRFVYIGDNSHGGLSLEEAETPPLYRTVTVKGKIEIGNNVWIGDKCTIHSVVHIGDNVIVAANSVVTHDIPSHSIWGGVSSREIKRIHLNQLDEELK